MKIFNDPIGNSTRDLPAYSAVSQPPAPSRAPIQEVVSTIFLGPSKHSTFTKTTAVSTQFPSSSSSYHICQKVRDIRHHKATERRAADDTDIQNYKGGQADLNALCLCRTRYKSLCATPHNFLPPRTLPVSWNTKPFPLQKHSQAVKVSWTHEGRE
jgi:hypothetical protein